MEIPIEIKKGNGHSLYGIIHKPDNEFLLDNKRIGIIILVPGIKYRVAPNRLSVKIARKLCLNGFYVLRFDPEGIGESGGDVGDNRPEKDIFVEIQKGLFVEDTIIAKRFFQKEYQFDEIAIIGNCGGAVTAILSQYETKIDQLILIDMPLVYSKKGTAKNIALRGGVYSEVILRSYMRNIFNFKSIKRFITFKSDYKIILGLLSLKLNNLFIKKLIKKNYPKNFVDIPLYTESGEEININVFHAFRDFLKRRGKAFLICAEFDQSRPLIETYLLNLCLEKDKDICDIHYNVINNANHIYTDIDSQNDLLESTLKWLKYRSKQ